MTIDIASHARTILVIGMEPLGFLRRLLSLRKDGPFIATMLIINEATMGNVLLVEDDLICQKVASHVLSKSGIAVTIANNSREALKLILGKKFNLVLMDLQLPEIDGGETALRIRAMADQYFKTVPILAFTSSTDVETKKKVSACGMNAIIPKPLSAQEFLTKINPFLI